MNKPVIQVGDTVHYFPTAEDYDRAKHARGGLHDPKGNLPDTSSPLPMIVTRVRGSARLNGRVIFDGPYMSHYWVDDIPHTPVTQPGCWRELG